MILFPHLLPFSLFSIGMVYVGVGALACARVHLDQRSTLDIFSFHSPSYFLISNILYFYVHVYVCDRVCTCECTYLQRTEEGGGTLGAGVINSFELTRVSAGNQTQFLWKKSSYSLKLLSRLLPP